MDQLSHPPELSQLLAATAADEDRYWEAFIRRHSRLLMHACRAQTRDYDAIMDRYAYVLEQLRADGCRRLRSYAPDGRTRFSTWLFTVARRLCVDLRRQRYGRPSAEGSAGDASDAWRARRDLVDLVGARVDLAGIRDQRNPAPDGSVLDQELRAALERSLAELSARDRLLLRLRFAHGATAGEIAALMAFPSPFHVYRHVNRVLGALRATLVRRGIDSPG